MFTRAAQISALAAASLLVACSSDPASTGGGGLSLTDRSLKSIGSNDAFYSALKSSLLRQGGGRDYQGISSEPVAEADMSDQAPVASGNNGEVVADSSSSASEVTGTNVQEQGVDEQDWVKVSSDGSRLYILKSDYDYGVYPVDDGLVDDVVIGDVESLPSSESNATSTIRIMGLDADAPDSSSLRNLDVDLDGRYAEGFYLYENEGSSSLFVTATGGNMWAYWDDATAFAGQDSLIARVDVSNVDDAAVNARIQFDGQIVSSRRIGKHLFFASRYYPVVPGEQPWTLSNEQWQAQVESADLSSLLPQYRVGGSETSQDMIDPENCFVAGSADSDPYYTPDIITLGVIDLDSMELSDSECYLGATETLYASPDAVFLATTQYEYSMVPMTEAGIEIDTNEMLLPVGSVWFDPRVDTDIHQFDIVDGQLAYAGTGTVNGHLGWNPLRKPFRMSEKDGYLRIATLNSRQGADDSSPILLSVLKANGNGELTTVASLPNETQPAFIGKPGEQLYASRFLGDKAYLVTFRQTDPLYIIDLANPESPHIAGELEIEGYSDYLHPVGEDYLLGIGKDAFATSSDPGDGRGALVQGVKLSLFNVSNPAEPVEVHSVLVGQRGTDAQVLSDHRAIAIQPATDDHPMRVSFGITVHGDVAAEQPASVDAAREYYEWNNTGLYGFDIKVGADAGIVPRGSLIVDSNASQDRYYPNYFQDRSVMVNDSVFYIYGSTVYAAPWDNLASPSAGR